MGLKTMKKRVTKTGRNSPYKALYAELRGLLANRWYSFTEIAGKPIERHDVDKIRSTLAHNARRGVYGDSWRLETEQGIDDKTGLYTFRVRKVRREVEA